MTKYIKILFWILALTACLVSGCTDRGTNSANRPMSGGEILVADHIFFNEFVLQIMNELQQFFMRVYIPEVAITPIHGGATPRPIPLLVLLAPQGADHNFFFNHGLKEIANEMIASGEIEPMAIACVPNDKVFGGYWYAGDTTRLGAGKYDQLIGGTLLDFLYSRLPFLIDSPDKRGIGGVGQGAYGAFRAAILNPGQFRSISATDGPLDFDGDGGAHGNGLIDLFDDALIEQGLKDKANAFREFDSTTDLAHLFIGGALAFSPHDTLVVWDSTHRLDFSGRWYIDIAIESREIITDSTTLVDSIIGSDPGSHDFDFHFPFDNTGAAFTLIWDMWLDDNLENMLSNQLAGVNIWIGTSQDAPWNFYDQTACWISTLRQQYPVQVREYTGYDGNVATGDQYLYDLLHDMLRHHSESFKD